MDTRDEITLGFINRLERLIGISETPAEDWEYVSVENLSTLLLLASVRIERLTEIANKAKRVGIDEYTNLDM
jgi:hypothetical protein